MLATKHQRFDSGKPTRELAICCVCYYDYENTASGGGCSSSAMLFSPYSDRYFNVCCTCSAEGEGREGAVGNQRRGGTTSSMRWPAVSPLFDDSNRARLSVYYTVRVLVDCFNDDKHVEHATLFHVFRHTPDNTDFNDEDLFIAPTTRQKPAEAASTKGPLHDRLSSGSPERLKLWPREGFIIVRLELHSTPSLLSARSS